MESSSGIRGHPSVVCERPYDEAKPEESQEEQFSIPALPIEIKANILKNCTTGELLTVSEVSTQCQDAANYVFGQQIAHSQNSILDLAQEKKLLGVEQRIKNRALWTVAA